MYGHRTPDTRGQARPTDTGQRTPLLALIASWAVLLASFGLSAATWISLAELAGFKESRTVSGQDLHLSWLMPIAVDGYVVVALVLWMSPVPARVASFARTNTYAAAGIGVAAQSAYHSLTTWQQDVAHAHTWQVFMAAVVGALPPAVAALAVHMLALIRRESGRTADTGQTPVRVVPGITVRTLPPATVADSRTPGQPDTSTRTATAGQRTPANSADTQRTVATADSGQVTVTDTRTPDTKPVPATPDTRPSLPDTVQRTVDTPATVDDLAARRQRKADSGQAADTSVEQLADTLGEHFGRKPVGRPAAMAHLKAVYGSCSGERAIAAKNLHNERINSDKENAV